jgi:glycosyltransferase involved in cell wall biosynthesis
MANVAIVLPALNEELTVETTIRAFSAALPDARIYVINNHSSDRTAAVAADTLREVGNRGAVIDEPRSGKGNAVRRAFRDIEADVYVLCDADNTYPPDRVNDLIIPILEDRADMVVGDRHSGGDYRRENDRPLHNFGNRFLQQTINVLFQADLVDIVSGYRAFSRVFVKNYPILVEGFQIETDMTLHALDKRFRIVEIPIEYRNRPPGSVSKLSTFSDGAKVIFGIFQILRYYRPLQFFGFLSFFFVIVGLITAKPVMDDWIQFRYIYHVPLAILAAALETVAVMMAVVGLILDSLIHHQKMEYERCLLNEPGDRSRWAGR